MNKKIILSIFLFGFLAVELTGCAGIRTNRKKLREQQSVIDGLNQEVGSLNKELSKVKQEKDAELARLQNIQKNLMYQLRKEIEAKDAQVKMGENGVTITFLAQIFFDSGKAVIKKEGLTILDKIVQPLDEIEREIRIEGHTDNEPIKHTKYIYKSNWELSAARALSVLHFLEGKGIDSKFLSAAGYGEFRPVVNNDSKSGRLKNRRVEIVILPKNIAVVENQPTTVSVNKKAPRKKVIKQIK